MRLLSVGFIGGKDLLLTLQIDGYLTHIDFDKYLEVCDKYKLLKLPRLTDAVQYYSASIEPFIPSYVRNKDLTYSPIESLNITKEAIREVFDNFELICKETNDLKNKYFYPFEKKGNIGFFEKKSGDHKKTPFDHKKTSEDCCPPSCTIL